MQRLRNALVAYFRSLKEKQHRPELYVLILGSVFGLLFVFLVPPMQGADETNHFLRAYQISEGSFISGYANNSVGGTLPAGIVRFSRVAVWNAGPGNSGDKVVKDDFKNIISIKNDGTRVTATFTNTAAYSPVAYAPRVAGIWLSRFLHLTPFYMSYIVRLSGLLFALPVLLLALRMLPFGRLPFAIIALLPMTMFQLSVISADTVMLPLCFLAIAAVLRYSYRQQDMSKFDIGFLLTIFALLSLTKPGLFPIALLSVAFLSNSFIGRRKAWLLCIATILVSVGATFAWNYLVKDLVTYGSHVDFAGSDSVQQLQFIISHPLGYLRVLYETVFTVKFDILPVGFIGNFGWLDAPLPLAAVITGFVLIAFATFFSSQAEEIRMSRWVRGMAAFAGLSIFLITATSMYILSNRLRLHWIESIQGRYLLPNALLTIVSFLAGKRTFSKVHFYALAERCLQVAAVLLVVSTIVIAARYYQLPVLVPFAD